MLKKTYWYMDMRQQPLLLLLLLLLLKRVVITRLKIIRERPEAWQSSKHLTFQFEVLMWNIKQLPWSLHFPFNLHGTLLVRIITY